MQELTQSQEQDQLIQYYLQEQIRKMQLMAQEKMIQEENERSQIKLQVYEMLFQKQDEDFKQKAYDFNLSHKPKEIPQNFSQFSPKNQKEISSNLKLEMPFSLLSQHNNQLDILYEKSQIIDKQEESMLQSYKSKTLQSNSSDFKLPQSLYKNHNLVQKPVQKPLEITSFQVQKDNFFTEGPTDEYEETFEEEIQECIPDDDDEQQQKFVQFSIKFEGSEIDQDKKRKFEAVRKKKLLEMEELKQLREKRRETPKREASPLLLKAKRPNQIDDRFEQSRPSEQSLRQFERPFDSRQQENKIEQRKIIPVMNQQIAITPVNQQRKAPGQRTPVRGSRDTAHFQNDDKDRSISCDRASNNKKKLKNAITYVCLAGEPNKREREVILQQLDAAHAEHYIILFKTFGRMDFKAVYGFSGNDCPYLIFQNSKSPQLITNDMVKSYYKYDSGAKTFKIIDGNKQFTIQVDAVQLRK